jgi:peptidoglycan/LPS O-acetylase OafA/YrhL
MRAARHIPALDGMRGVAILLAMLAHFEAAASEAIGEPSRGLSALGWFGVDLFFALSGFLITGILLDAKGTPHYFRDFYARRALRIFPLYYGVLAALFLVGPAAGFARGIRAAIGRDQAWFWCYGVNALIALKGRLFPLAHFWSLAVEEHFYLAWPLVVLALPRRRLIASCLGLIVVAAAVRVALLGRANPLAIYVLTPCRMDALAAGAAFAAAVRGPEGFAGIRRKTRWLAFAGCVLLAGLAAWRWPLTELDPVAQSVGYTLTGATFAALVALATDPGSPLGRPLDCAPLRFMGKYSYGAYVYHPFVMGLVGSHLHRYPQSVPLGIAVMTATTFAVAWASWQVYERPFIRLKRLFE